MAWTMISQTSKFTRLFLEPFFNVKVPSMAWMIFYPHKVSKSNLCSCCVFFLLAESEVKIRLCGWAGSYWYLLFSCGLVTSLMLRHIFFSRQQNPDEAAQMPRLIQVFTLLMWHRDISHIAVHFFFQQTVNYRSGCTDVQAHMGNRCSFVA